ncbi:super-infection exclusion protein B [Riemerella anatipestifer]|nr:super-infection exclusion protein B [Riemerella anatipestifer]
METLLSKLFDLNKIPTKIIFLLAIVSGLLMFLPDTILSQLYITEFKKDYGKYFGIIFIISISFLFINLLIWIFKKINVYVFRKKISKKLMKNLNELTFAEQSVIREFFIKNEPAIKLPYDNPIVKNLINKGIVVRISDIGEQNVFAGMLFPFKLNDKLKDKITDEILGLDTSKTDEENLDFAFANRPNWAKELDRIDEILKFRY